MTHTSEKGFNLKTLGMHNCFLVLQNNFSCMTSTMTRCKQFINKPSADWSPVVGFWKLSKDWDTNRLSSQGSVVSHNKELLSNSIEHQNIKVFGTYKRMQMQMLGLGLASHPGMDNDRIFSLKKYNLLLLAGPIVFQVNFNFI